MNPIFNIDFYKVGHIHQYPKGITKVYSNWTPRYSRIPGRNGSIHFGLQYFIKKVLIDQFRNEFFDRQQNQMIREYKEVVRETLGAADPFSGHIEALWNKKYLPLAIYSVPEGVFVPSGVPAMVIVNTEPEFFWLPNYIETMLSNYLWQPSTSATTASRYKEIFVNAAKRFGEKDLSFTDWQGHDFSYRGLSGLEAAELSGMGHLTSFSGTDTIPAILAARKYYGASLNIGGSVPATEHSVMCAGGMDGEFETFKRLITEVYPNGIVSIVSDTWDLWKVLTDYIPRLKNEILARDGKLVIRPDSGDPVKILCGNPDSSFEPEKKGVLRLLAEVMGTDGNGHINKAGAIYGDSITPERAEQITSKAIEMNLSPYNVVLGIGSYTYQMVTRDTYGFAMKATAVEKDGNLVPIFKDPVTDPGGKKSHDGIPVAAWYNSTTRKYLSLDPNVTPDRLEDGAFDLVFKNGKLLVNYSFSDIRDNVKGNNYED